jgi:hypothetical protein
MKKTLQTLGLVGAITTGLVGCDYEVTKGTYTFAPLKMNSKNNERHNYVTVNVDAWQKSWGRRMIIYNPDRRSEHIQATDSTEFGDTQLWEEVRIPVPLSRDSPLHYLDDPKRLEEIWNNVNKTRTSGDSFVGEE